MTEADLIRSLRRRLFYSMLGGFAAIYLALGHLDFVAACPLGAVVAAALFVALSPLKGKARGKGGMIAFLTIATFPLFLLLFQVGHTGLDEPAAPLIPFPVRLVLVLLMPCVVVAVGGRWLARGEAGEGPLRDV